jgi:hypothetical protein
LIQVKQWELSWNPTWLAGFWYLLPSLLSKSIESSCVTLPKNPCARYTDIALSLAIFAKSDLTNPKRPSVQLISKESMSENLCVVVISHGPKYKNALPEFNRETVSSSFSVPASALD